MNKSPSFLGPAFAALLSLAGLIGFIVLFARDMTVYWVILAPLILIVYQFPAFVVFRMWKRKRNRARSPEVEEVRDEAEGSSPGPAPDSGPEDEDRRESEG